VLYACGQPEGVKEQEVLYCIWYAVRCLELIVFGVGHRRHYNHAQVAVRMPQRCASFMCMLCNSWLCRLGCFLADPLSNLTVVMFVRSQPDGDAWRSTPSVAEKTLLGLAVADCSLALVNGALPSSFDPQHSPASWWMEALFKV